MSTSLSFAVSMMIGTVERVRISRHTSVPGSPGSMRSSSTRSAPVRSNAAIADGPSAAISDVVALTLEQEARAGRSATISSSTSRMRVIGVDAALRRRRPREAASPRLGAASRPRPWSASGRRQSGW